MKIFSFLWIFQFIILNNVFVSAFLLKNSDAMFFDNVKFKGLYFICICFYFIYLSKRPLDLHYIDIRRYKLLIIIFNNDYLYKQDFIYDISFLNYKN